MRLIVFSTVFLLISFTSCKSREAIEFREAIVQKERVASNMLLGKNGLESRKLDHLIKNDYKGALALVDKQEEGFNKLIKEIETLPADGIKQGNELKTAAADYYIALKELHLFDRVEITHREASLHMEGETLQAAQNKSLQLTLQKLDMYKKVYEKDSVFYHSLEKFNSANGI